MLTAVVKSAEVKVLVLLQDDQSLVEHMMLSEVAYMAY